MKAQAFRRELSTSWEDREPLLFEERRAAGDFRYAR
jgi:hypothetical protein